MNHLQKCACEYNSVFNSFWFNENLIKNRAINYLLGKSEKIE